MKHLSVKYLWKIWFLKWEYAKIEKQAETTERERETDIKNNVFKIIVALMTFIEFRWKESEVVQE